MQRLVSRHGNDYLVVRTKESRHGEIDTFGRYHYVDVIDGYGWETGGSFEGTRNESSQSCATALLAVSCQGFGKEKGLGWRRV